MRKVDPHIKLMAIGGNNFTRFDFLSDKDWNKKILEGLGNKIDFLSVHNGYAPLIVENQDYTVEDVYAALLAFPKLMEANFEQVSSEIEKSGVSDPGRIKIAVTEWAPLFHVATTSPWVDHPKTLGSGLYTAGALHAMIRNPRVCLSTFFKLKDFFFSGTIGFDNIPKSSFYALKLYSRLIGHNLVQCNTVSPIYHSKALGLIPEIKDVPFLDVIAATSADDKSLSIVAINRSCSAPLLAHIAIEHFKPQSHCSVTSFSAKNIDSNNGKDIPDVPGYVWKKQKQASTNPQFDQGGAGTLRLAESEFDKVSPNFDYLFPPHSITKLTLRALRQ